MSLPELIAELDRIGDELMGKGREDLHGLADDLANVRATLELHRRELVRITGVTIE